MEIYLINQKGVFHEEETNKYIYHFFSDMHGVNIDFYNVNNRDNKFNR